MKPIFAYFLLLTAGLLLAGRGLVRADGRAGSVEFSDGRKLAGALSLTPGKDLKLFTSAGPVEVQLNEVTEIRFKPEKETMAEGFYFPNAGQATQAKTGDVYPTREFQTEITLADGKVLDGHLFTTTLYVENGRRDRKGRIHGKANRRRRRKADRSGLSRAGSVRCPCGLGRHVRK